MTSLLVQAIESSFQLELSKPTGRAEVKKLVPKQASSESNTATPARKPDQ